MMEDQFGHTDETAKTLQTGLEGTYNDGLPADPFGQTSVSGSSSAGQYLPPSVSGMGQYTSYSSDSMAGQSPVMGQSVTDQFPVYGQSAATQYPPPYTQDGAMPYPPPYVQDGAMPPPPPYTQDGAMPPPPPYTQDGAMPPPYQPYPAVYKPFDPGASLSTGAFVMSLIGFWGSFIGLFLGIGAVIMSYLGKQKTLNAGLVPSKINQAALIVGIIDIVIGGLRIIWFFLEFLFKIF